MTEAASKMSGRLRKRAEPASKEVRISLTDRNTDAGVRYLHDQLIHFGADCQRDFSAFDVLDGIVQQVDEQADESVHVAI